MNHALPWALHRVIPNLVVDRLGAEVCTCRDPRNAELLVEWSRLGAPSALLQSIDELNDREADDRKRHR